MKRRIYIQVFAGSALAVLILFLLTDSNISLRAQSSSRTLSNVLKGYIGHSWTQGMNKLTFREVNSDYLTIESVSEKHRMEQTPEGVEREVGVEVTKRRTMIPLSAITTVVTEQRSGEKERIVGLSVVGGNNVIQ